MTNKEHPLHSMCSYLGAFPPSVPRRIIRRWIPDRATVLDPFCGGGTTLLEAAAAGRRAVGMDLNPLAVAVARAKLQDVSPQGLRYRLTELAQDFCDEGQADDVPGALRVVFHRRTLTQLCYLRDALDGSSPEDVFLRGAILGIMHGKFRKSGDTAYLSVDMPNTFSMSPDYVRGFIEKHGLLRPSIDVFKKLQERILWLLRQGTVPGVARARVLNGDAAHIPQVIDDAGIGSIGGIVTSPPYLGVLRYGAFNWIRLWFLKTGPRQVDAALDGTDSIDGYLSFAVNFLRASAEVLRPGAHVVLVVGDVVENGQHVRLARRVWQEVGDLIPFELERIERDRYDTSTKTTRIWGDKKKGRATPVDRVMVLRRIPRRRQVARTG